MAFVHLRRGLQLSSRTQKLFCVRLARFGQHQPEIEVGLEDFRLGGNRFAVCGDGVILPAQRVVHKPEVEPRLKIASVAFHNFFQQNLGPGQVLLPDIGLGLAEFRRKRRILHRHPVMTHGPASILRGNGETDQNAADRQSQP